MLAPFVRRTLPAFALLLAACAAPSTQQELESRTGLSASEMAELRAKKGLDDEDFRRLAPERLRKILARVRELAFTDGDENIRALAARVLDEEGKRR